MHVIPDDRSVLVRAVVIRRDRSCAVVDVAPHRRVTDIGEMIRLGATTQRARLDLDEIADVDLVVESGAGAQARIRPDPAARTDRRVVQMRERQDRAAGGDRHIAQYAVRADVDVVSQRNRTFKHTSDIDAHVAPAGQRAANVDARGIRDPRAGFEQRFRSPVLDYALRKHQLCAIVDAAHFAFIVSDLRGDGNALGNSHRDDIGQVILALCVVRHELRDPACEQCGRRSDESGIDLVDRAFSGRRIAILDDRFHTASGVTHDAAQAVRVRNARRQEAYIAAPCMIDDRGKRCGRRERHVGQADQRHTVPGHGS